MENIKIIFESIFRRFSVFERFGFSIGSIIEVSCCYCGFRVFIGVWCSGRVFIYYV